MRVIPPIAITDSILTSSSVVEPSSTDPPVWSASVSYSLGSQVTVGGTIHKVYECIVTSITGGDAPNISLTRAVPKWIEVGATNRWSMFDLLRSSASTSESDINVVLTLTTSIDSIAVLGTSGISSVRVIATSGVSTVYDKVLSLSSRLTLTWTGYFFGELASKTTVIAFDLPSEYSNLVLNITALGSGTRKIGALVVGKSSYVGKLLKGATIDSLNFSTIDRDVFGNAILVPRRSVPKTNQRIYIDKSDLTTVHKLRDSLDAIPAVWSGFDDDYTNDYFDALVILGFYRTFAFQLDNPIGPIIDLELEEI